MSICIYADLFDVAGICSRDCLENFLPFFEIIFGFKAGEDIISLAFKFSDKVAVIIYSIVQA